MKPIIGLEIHVQLKTKSKMFCGCDATYFGEEPNTHMCPVCLALPGALPVANKKALENAVKVGLALHCNINNFSRFDRKNYMYPDLFKGYQITQYEIPICENGYADITKENGDFLRVGIIRAHQEEDTAKSIHEDGYTLIDGNKAGVPLLEIVSAPDMTSAEDALAYAQYIYNTIRFIGVSDCDMEKGQMRFDVNINVQLEEEHPNGEKEIIATPIVEVKNLNSFKSMERAIQYEVERQQDEYKRTGIKIGKGNKTTRGWSDDKGETYLLRSKEEAEDYRYFPEPDLPPVIFTDEQIEQLRSEIGKLPAEIFQDFTQNLHFNTDIASFFVYSSNARDFYHYFEEARLLYTPDNVKNLANWIKGELAFNIYEQHIDPKTIDAIIPTQNFVHLLDLIDKGNISSTAGKEVLQEMITSKKDADAIIAEKGLAQVSDVSVIEKLVDTAIAQNSSAVENYKSGKTGALMFIVGQVMKEMKGKGNPGVIKEIVEKKLQ